MERLAVESKTLVAVGYEPASGLLEVEFRSGLIYRYECVPVELHRLLLSAESKGRFFNHHIRNQFQGIPFPLTRSATKTI